MGSDCPRGPVGLGYQDRKQGLTLLRVRERKRDALGSSPYLILALIGCLPLAPVAGAGDTDDTIAVGVPHGEDPAANLSEAEETLLCLAVRQVPGDHPSGSAKAYWASTKATPCLR